MAKSHVSEGDLAAVAKAKELKELQRMVKAIVDGDEEEDDFSVDAFNRAIQELHALKDLKSKKATSLKLIGTMACPEEFRCPLSKDLMRDPVIVSIGQVHFSCRSSKGRSHKSQIKFGFSQVKGKADHPMEDYHVAKFIQMQEHELGLFAIFDGHSGDDVPAYLQKYLFDNILKEEEFWTDPSRSTSKAYENTDQTVLSQSSNLGRGDSTAVTAILINCLRLWVANVGDSRAVLSKGDQASQLTTDHEPNTERGSIENKGGFVLNLPAKILRALRIAAHLGLSLWEETQIAIRKLSSSVSCLAQSRLMLEFNYMLSYGAAEPSLCLLL